MFDIAYRTVDIIRCIEKHDPFAAGEGFGVALERMNLAFAELCCGRTFELNHQLVGIESVTCHDQMNMIAQDGTGVNYQTGFPRIRRESGGHGVDLRHRELHGRAFERSLGGDALAIVVGTMRNRAGFGGFGCRAVAEEFPRTDERGPRTTGIIGKPKAVGPKMI